MEQENQAIHMTKSLSNFVIAAAFTAALAFSQTTTSGTRTPPTPAQTAQHQVQRLTTLLSLTSEQQTEAITIFINSATANTTVHTNMKTAQTALKTAIESNDTATINTTATGIGVLEGQLTANTALADAAFYNLLTADQKTKYAALGGRGGFGGGGFGPQFRGGH
jgi:Spy/CpxP family protein refolding chaperone